MRYKVKDRMTITRDDGTLLGAGNILEDPTDFEIQATRECLEVHELEKLAPAPTARRKPKATQEQEKTAE